MQRFINRVWKYNKGTLRNEYGPNGWMNGMRSVESWWIPSFSIITVIKNDWKPKMKSIASCEQSAEKLRKMMFLSQRVVVWDKLGWGESAASLRRHFGVNESSIHQMKKCAENVRRGECSGVTTHERVTAVNRTSTWLTSYWWEEWARNLTAMLPAS